ncbi:MAG: hypothetical protein PHW74_11365 [Desulfobacca sp.]|nr:hypothetical protein [Desulfobacca sp.]
MKKLIIRLLSIIMVLYGIGLFCQLNATEPGKRELPPPELDKDKYRALEPAPQAPTGLRGGGCYGCGESEIPVKPEPEAEATTKAEEQAEVEAEAEAEEQITEKPEEKTPEKPPKKGQVYAAMGHGAAGYIGAEKGDQVLEDTFGKDSFTTGDRPNRQQLLENIPKSEVVLLNAHGFPTTKWIRDETGADVPQIDTDGSEEGKIHPADLARSVRAAGTAPKVTFLNVCAVGSKKDPKQFSFSDALGVTPTTQGRAVIGYKSKILGKDADDLSFETLKEWKKGGTLKEALERAKATMSKSEGRRKGARMLGAGYAPDEAVLIGDGNIKFSDLTGSPAQVRR